MNNKLMLNRCFFSKNIQDNGKITVIVGSSHSDVFRNKSRKTANAHAKEIILVKIRVVIKNFVNWILPSTAAMDYSRCFPQFEMVYIFLKYSFQHISQMTLPNVYSISVKCKTTEMKHNEQKWWALPNSLKINLLHPLLIL